MIGLETEGLTKQALGNKKARYGDCDSPRSGLFLAAGRVVGLIGYYFGCDWPPRVSARGSDLVAGSPDKSEPRQQEHEGAVRPVLEAPVLEAPCPIPRQIACP